MGELETIKKLNIVNFEARELRAYLFISRSEEIRVAVESINLIFGYDLDFAESRVEKDAPAGFYIKKMGSIPVKELLKRIETEGFFVKTEEKVEPKTTKEQFLCNLQLCAEEFLKGEDKKKLKEIIKNIK